MKLGIISRWSAEMEFKQAILSLGPASFLLQETGTTAVGTPKA